MTPASIIPTIHLSSLSSPSSLAISSLVTSSFWVSCSNLPSTDTRASVASSPNFSLNGLGMVITLILISYYMGYGLSILEEKFWRKNKKNSPLSKGVRGLAPALV
ncbi:MAG: hypothetical protein HY097_08400 [Nitrospinae bacterium]|nr:hypothetical protein [Nitrospinota bacterium]